MKGEAVGVGKRPERRAALRHRAIVDRLWLGWRDGHDFIHTPARLLDLSHGGCLVVAAASPPAERTVLLHLHGDLLPVWFEARVLEAVVEEDGLRTLRLVFPTGCPYELYMAVAYGLASAEAGRRQPELPSYFEEWHLGHRDVAPRRPFR
ncbi:MAG TPA: PilZ domain-containing protein [Isosphaeraceae bacterium]|jgi:hypothetical protein|nr:PilZ domain-containing protein [Isosphaeraceae bacterium]